MEQTNQKIKLISWLEQIRRIKKVKHEMEIKNYDDDINITYLLEHLLRVG
jgi:hypothetical protein